MDAHKPFACDVCGKSFRHKRNVTTHKKIHTGEKPYKCVQCKKTFSDSSSLDNHRTIHTGEKPYECGICEISFSKHANLAKHKKIHADEKPYECDICKKTFSVRNSLAQHRRIHTGETPYACNVCEKAFNQTASLAKHKRTHTGEKPYSCDICQKSYADNSNFTRHNKSVAHLKKRERRNKYFSLNFNNHVDCSENIKVEDIKEKIKEEESVEDPLSIHQKTENSNVHKDIMQKKKDRESVEDPISIHQEIESSNFCEDIKEEIKEEVEVNLRAQSMKPMINRKCIVCKKFIPELLFNAHQCKTHKCVICKENFTSSVNLAKHKRIHTGKKSYECDICKKKFSQSSTLAKHKRIHAGEKPYACKVCEKTFSLSDHLVRFMNINSENYFCNTCQKSCSQRADLSPHIKITANLNRLQCKNKNTFVDCGEAIKVEDIKEEINEEESVDDPLSIQGETTKNKSNNIVTEVKEEVIDDGSLCVQHIHNSGDGENITVVDDVDIVEHKIETDI